MYTCINYNKYTNVPIFNYKTFQYHPKKVPDPYGYIQVFKGLITVVSLYNTPHYNTNLDITWPSFCHSAHMVRALIGLVQGGPGSIPSLMVRGYFQLMFPCENLKNSSRKVISLFKNKVQELDVNSS